MPALRLYSAHDSTLIALLCAMRLARLNSTEAEGDGSHSEVWPGYGAHLMIELLAGDGYGPPELRFRSPTPPTSPKLKS